MREKPEYYLIGNRTTDMCDVSNEEYERALRSWLCSTCSTPKANDQPIDVTLNYMPPGPPLTFVNRCALGIIRKDFLSLFDKRLIANELILGQVKMADSKECPDWLTYRTRHQLIVRGSKHAKKHRCEACGTLHYFAQGKRYLFPRPNPEISIFQHGCVDVVVRPDAFPNLRPKDWPGLLMMKLTVLDEPLDGLGLLEDS